MILFLKLVGAFLVAFAIFVLVLYLWIRAKIRRFMKTVSDAVEGIAAGVGSIQPMRIHLVLTDQPDWEDEDAVDALAQPLLEQGFVEAGVYEAEGGGGATVTIRAMVDSSRDAYVSIYEVGDVARGLDLVTRYTDGTSVTYSNIKPHGMDSPPGKSVEFFEGLPAGELLERFLHDRPDREAVPVSAEQFVEVFEQYYAEEMDWRMERGGPTEEEIRRVAEADGNEVTDDSVAQLRLMWSAHFSNFLQEELRKNFLSQSNLSAESWENIRDRLTFVYDKLDAEDVAELCDDDEDEGDAEEWDARHEENLQLAKTKGARAAFAQWNETASESARYEKIGQTSDPVDADVYLAPEYDEDDYDDE